jgi:hypothetical protein
MKTMPLGLLLLAFSMLPTTEMSQAQSLQEAHSAAAVIAADKSWTIAEEKGDVAYLEDLLLPGYRSIAPDGTVHDKEAILAASRNTTPERVARIEKYLTDHPTDMQVTIEGDTAILTFTPKNEMKKLILSCDIFLYRKGRWHAIYSQHTDAEKS